MVDLSSFKILYQYPFCKTAEDRFANLYFSTIYANRQLIGKHERIIIESTPDGISRIQDSVNDFRVMTYAEPRFSISRCRNNCLKYAWENGFDFLVMIDADVLIEKGQIEKSINHLIASSCPLVYPFNGHFFNISRNQVQSLPEFKNIDLSHQVDMNPPGEAPGGYIALDMNKLQRGTMFFEGFRGWGFEDTQFLYSVIQKYGIPSRVQDIPVIHLDHGRSTSHYNMNDALYNQRVFHEMFRGFNPVTKFKTIP